jgi:hypothetical protein
MAFASHYLLARTRSASLRADSSAGSPSSAACGKDYEFRTDSSEAFIFLAAARLLIARLTRL